MEIEKDREPNCGTLFRSLQEGCLAQVWENRSAVAPRRFPQRICCSSPYNFFVLLLRRSKRQSMTTPQEIKPKGSLSDYLAAERTLLAWIRTGLAMMGFGFVVARFGLFLHQIQLINKNAATVDRAYGESLWFGTALIAAGVFVNLLAGYRHIQLVRELEYGIPTTAYFTRHAVAVAVFLAVVGLAMAIYLISIRS